MKLLEVLKRVFSAAIVMAASLAQFTSCDSREDWFAKEGEGATFIIKTSKSYWWDDEERYEFKNDTVYGGNHRVVEYNLKLNITDWSNGMYYFSENLKLDIEGFGRKVTRTYKEINMSTEMNNPEIINHDALGQDLLNFFGRGNPATNTDTVAKILNTAYLTIELEDVFKNTFYCYVKINFLGDISPEPILEIRDVDGNPMEKVLDLSKSFDRDGSIEKYEYCIDGEIVEYSRPTFDCYPAGVTAGKGAYGGTYITSTEDSEIKHAFQTEGEHIVYYRCMDNVGLWSLWKNAIVTIE